MSHLPNTVPVSLITGFLGSGKTTLLSALLKMPEMTNTAVIINEFGDVGLDHSLVEHSDENIVELQSGCICCTIQDDLHQTLQSLIARRYVGSGFDRVVIETTGLADPVPIIHTLMTSPELQSLYHLDSVVTVVDAVNGSHTLDTHRESCKQAAMAERILLSKTDLVSKDVREELIDRLHHINPAAKILTGRPPELSVSDLFGEEGYDPFKKTEDVRSWLQAEAYQRQEHEGHHHHHHNVNRHNNKIESFAITHEQPIHGLAFEMFIEIMAAKVGPQLLRMKGIVNVKGEDRPAVVHGVQHIFHPVQWLDQWPDEDHRTRLVIITQSIKKEVIEGFFNTLIAAMDEACSDESVAAG
jgi:G3E family GTPase